MIFGRHKGDRSDGDPERRPRHPALRGWLIVCAISLAFVAYGFFAFFMIGDRGSHEWDFGSVRDVPGQSVYSTYPYREDSGQPEPQHVDQRPSAAQAGTAVDRALPPAGKQPKQEPGKK